MNKFNINGIETVFRRGGIEVNYRQNQVSQEHGRKSVKVFGEGTVLATPDQVEIRLGVITQDENILAAQQENTDKMSAVIAAIKEWNVSEEEIQTAVYRIDPEYDFIEGVQVFRGYRIVHLVQVTLDQVNLAGNVIDSAVRSGVNSITSVDFTLKDRSSAYQIALKQAVDNANVKARTIAESLNVTINPIPSQVTEISPYQVPERYPAVLSAQVTPIQPGQLSFVASVEVIFTYY
jgi:uncharacterized protein YggE